MSLFSYFTELLINLEYWTECPLSYGHVLLFILVKMCQNVYFPRAIVSVCLSFKFNTVLTKINVFLSARPQTCPTESGNLVKRCQISVKNMVKTVVFSGQSLRPSPRVREGHSVKTVVIS